MDNEASPKWLPGEEEWGTILVMGLPTGVGVGAQCQLERAGGIRRKRANPGSPTMDLASNGSVEHFDGRKLAGRDAIIAV